MYQAQRLRPLFIGGGGTRGEPSASIHVPTTSRHFASLKIVRTPPLAAPLKDALDDGSPYSMGQELPQVKTDTELKTLPRPIQAHEFEGVTPLVLHCIVSAKTLHEHHTCLWMCVI